MYETRVIEAEDNFRCEISYRRESAREPSPGRLKYQEISNFFQFVQAVVLVASVL
ncbi:MAG: hypothetical protein MUF20_00635 [Methylotetracoccus sp.]|jgi:hypothetical protein|nr:hypothetical protein [Methylotetracoccus sp.]